MFGVVLLAVNIWTYNALDWVYVNNADLRAYSVSFPNVKNVKEGQLRPGFDKSQLVEPEVGDYKIMLKNDVLPHSDEDMYIMPADTYINYLNSGKIQAEDLGTYLHGQFKHEFGYADQEDPVFSADIEVDLSNAAFYIVIICTTWALYTSQTRLASNERIAWIIASVAMGVLTGGIMYNSGTIRQRVSFLYIVRRMLILTISFAITAVLI
jgi:hypothetical protein